LWRSYRSFDNLLVVVLSTILALLTELFNLKAYDKKGSEG
jgi:hypothetical protein